MKITSEINGQTYEFEDCNEPIEYMILVANECAIDAYHQNLDKKEEWLNSWMGVDSVWEDAWHQFSSMIGKGLTEDEESDLTMLISDKIYHLYKGDDAAPITPMSL